MLVLSWEGLGWPSQNQPLQLYFWTVLPLARRFPDVHPGTVSILTAFLE